MEIALKIEGMHCGGCAESVRKALSRVEGVEAVAVDLDSGSARINASAGATRETLVAAVEDAGYDVTG